MYVAAVGLAMFLLYRLHCRCYRRLWDRGLSFRAGFSQSEAFEGDEVQLRMELANDKFLPLPWVSVSTGLPDDFGDAAGRPAGGMLAAAMPYRILKKRAGCACKKRGAYRLRRARIAVANLLHTEEFVKDAPLGGELVVYPRTLEDSPAAALALRAVDSLVQSRRPLNPDPFEFRGIREYMPTDPLKSVNFKATAVAQRLMVNVHAPTTERRLALALNMDGAEDYLKAELYEQSIRLAATLAKRYISDGADLSFFTNGLDAESRESLAAGGGTSGGHLHRIYDCLARVSLLLGPPPMGEFLDRFCDRERVLVLVSPAAGAGLAEALERLALRQVACVAVAPYFSRAELGAPRADVVPWDAREP